LKPLARQRSATCWKACTTPSVADGPGPKAVSTHIEQFLLVPELGLISTKGETLGPATHFGEFQFSSSARTC
jgi:hypothetical protein